MYSVHVHTHAGCVCVQNLLSNNFHIRLILKGQKLLGSQQWADGGWLNMHLIPFGLVSVSKPPTFLSHNHSYRFSNQFGAPTQTEMTSDQQLAIVMAKTFSLWSQKDVWCPHNLLWLLKMTQNGHNVNSATLFWSKISIPSAESNSSFLITMSCNISGWWLVFKCYL